MNDHKHFGLILDSKRTFANHISEKVSKALKGVGVIKYLSSYVPVKTLDQIYKMYVRPHLDSCDVIYHTPKTLDQIYKMYVRPHLDFCDVIYHTPTICNMFDPSFRLSHWMDLIERVQYMAALAVTGTRKGTSCNKIYEQLGWESLSDRRWFHRLVQLFKIQNGFTPTYLKTPSSPVSTKSSFRYRNENDLTVLNVTPTCTAFILIL